MPHRLTTPALPDAWLLLLRFQDNWLVHGVYDAPNSPDLLQRKAESLALVTERDDPSLVVKHSGLVTHTPSWLRARDNWFLRYQTQLEPFLVNPKIAQAFTFAPGKFTDPLSTFKAKWGGPCPLPRGTPWPTCGFCNSPMVMVGVLDFRDFDQVLVPHGSLVLHGCPECSLCADEETWSVHWLIDGEPLDLYGDETHDIQVGTRWWVTEYPTPSSSDLDSLCDSGRDMQGERSPYNNFVGSSDKVGGHVFWIQEDEFANTPYVYIGQMTGDDESLCKSDSPMVYLMYSPETGKTIASVQSF